MPAGRRTIAVIGAGNVGATCAFALAERKLGNIVMLDIFEGFAKGKALDMSQAGQILNYDGVISGTSSYEDIAGADVVVVTSGFPRQPGMTREDLISKNAGIISEVGKGIKEYAPDSIVIVVTNPLDLMTYHMWKTTGFPAERVVGQAGILDSARMTHFIAEAVGVSNEDVQAMVLGGHGDTMVPLPRFTKVSGKPLLDLVKEGKISEERLESINQRTRDGGAEIVKFLEKGSAFYAPAASGVQMAEAYLNNSKQILPCAVFLNGEYGFKDVYAGVPVVIGKNGVEKIEEIELDEKERKEFNHSVESVKKLWDAATSIDPDLK